MACVRWEMNSWNCFNYFYNSFLGWRENGFTSFEIRIIFRRRILQHPGSPTAGDKPPNRPCRSKCPVGLCLCLLHRLGKVAITHQKPDKTLRLLCVIAVAQTCHQSCGPRQVSLCLHPQMVCCSTKCCTVHSEWLLCVETHIHKLSIFFSKSARKHILAVRFAVFDIWWD